MVIELDGSGHYEEAQIIKDEERTKDLAELNLTVVRIPNTEVDRNFSGVCRYIDYIVQNSLPPSTPLTPPSTDGGC